MRYLIARITDDLLEEIIKIIEELVIDDPPPLSGLFRPRNAPIILIPARARSPPGYSMKTIRALAPPW